MRKVNVPVMGHLLFIHDNRMFAERAFYCWKQGEKQGGKSSAR